MQEATVMLVPYRVSRRRRVNDKLELERVLSRQKGVWISISASASHTTTSSTILPQGYSHSSDETSPTKPKQLIEKTNNNNCSVGYIEGTRRSRPRTSKKPRVPYSTSDAPLSPHRRQSSSKRGESSSHHHRAQAVCCEGRMLPVHDCCAKEATS